MRLDYQVYSDKIPFQEWKTFFNSNLEFKGDIGYEIKVKELEQYYFYSFLESIHKENKFFIPIKIDTYQEFQVLRKKISHFLPDDASCYFILNKKLIMFKKRKGHLTMALSDDMFDFLSDYERILVFKN